MSKIKSEYNCELELTHNLIGGKWKMRVLWHIINGDNRFSELKKAIPEITEKVLYTNLRELEGVGIIYKEIRSEQKPIAVFYYLEKDYTKLKSLIKSVCEFTRDYARLNNIDLK